MNVPDAGRTSTRFLSAFTSLTDHYHVLPRSQIRPASRSRSGSRRHRRLRTVATRFNSDAAYETAYYCLMDTLACGFQALEVSGVHQAHGPGRARRDHARRSARARHLLRARSGAGRLQHRRHDSLAGFQRHLARGRVGSSVRQSRRHSGGGGLSVASQRRAGQEAADREGRAHGHDQGARDPGRHCAREQFQSRRARSRPAGADRLHGGHDRHARRHARAGHQRGLECLDRRRRAAHLSACPEHRLAQELGGRRCHQPRGPPCADRADRRDGLSVRAHARKTWGFQDVLFKGKALVLSAGVSAATSWRTCCSRSPSRPSSMPRRRWKPP